MKKFKKFVAFVLLFSFISFNSSSLVALAVDDVVQETVVEETTPTEETVPEVEENLVIDQQPNVAVSKINICHKNGESWMFMDTPAGSSLDGHLGHGDFLYDDSWGEGNDQKCTEHSPIITDFCPNLEGVQTSTNDCLPPQEAQISITKIICPTEDLLPNWGSGGVNIDAATAQDFLVTHPTCYEQHGWKYEWAPNGTANPGDNVEIGGGAWQSFDENNLPEIPAGTRAWVREQIPSGYIPFSSDTNGGNGWNDVSAEFYCNNDVLNYDNYDYIDPVVAGQLYHCVAFNVPVNQEEPETATISAKKLVCDSEADLPNWGAEGGPNITATTASDYVLAHPNCEIVPWTFEWSPTADNPGGDNVEVAGGTWTAFTSTIAIPTSDPHVAWVREQMKPGYIPFTGESDSAEFYCGNDVLTYDNLELIYPVEVGQTYHCVGFNVLVEREEPPQCNPEVNLLENGNFEAPALGLNTWGIIPDSNPLLKWLVSWTNPQTSGTLGLEIQNNVAGASFEGSQHAELDGDHPVTISQTIPTIIGKTYDLSFAYSARPGRDAADNTIEVKAGGNVLGAILSDDGTSLINTLWGTQTRSFVATSTSTTIEFKDTGSDTSFGGYLDNVDLRCNPEQKDDGFIHIYKFVDGEQATSESVNGVSFPMFNNRDVNTYTLNPNGWWGGNDQSPADIPYEATAWQAGGGTYSTWENLSTDLVGASCEEGKPYALEGYSSGATLQDAIANGANKTLETPSFVIDGNVNVIVWNKKCVDEEEDPTGSIEITKYLCPSNFVPNRNDNSVGDPIPEGCTPLSGVAFGYVHGSQTDANGPYPELDITPTPGGTTNGSGVLTISPVQASGRYLIKETDPTNLLGLYCEGDGDTNPNNNDNQELTFVPEDGTAHCVAYNKASIVIDTDPAQCSDEFDNDQDGLNNQADPGCHTDGNVNNPQSYDPNDDSESNDGAICSDGKDNDEDGLVDSNDPGCHDNNNLNDPWNPNDTDESNSTPTVNNSSSRGSSGSRPGGQGLVLGAETSCGIYVDKFLRRGYKNDVEAVKKVQQFLNNYMNAGLPITGYFGIQTEKALKKFQTAYPETVLGPWGFKKPTGIFYLTTQTQVNNIMCPELKLPIPVLTPIETNPLAPKKA